MTIKVLALSRAARKHLSDKKIRRGKYTKQAEREAAKSLPPAWKIGDRKSFAAARARVMTAICGDACLSGKAKAVLSACIEHMNPDSQFSCFAAMPSIAKEAGVNVATCWRTINATEGKYIHTRRGKRYRNHGYTATEITIHSRFANTSATDYVAEMRPSLETTSQSCDKLHRNAANITFFKEPIEIERKMGIREREDGFRASPDSEAFQCWKSFFEETKQAAMLRELQNREQSGRAFNFLSEWPSCRWPRGR